MSASFPPRPLPMSSANSLSTGTGVPAPQERSFKDLEPYTAGRSSKYHRRMLRILTLPMRAPNGLSATGPTPCRASGPRLQSSRDHGRSSRRDRRLVDPGIRQRSHQGAARIGRQQSARHPRQSASTEFQTSLELSIRHRAEMC